jgi:glycine/D-amino acid oxidase-like deaminating enzyme
LPYPKFRTLDRRRLLGGSLGLGGMAALGGCASIAQPAPVASAPARTAGYLDLAPIRARPDRLFDITCCLRPFRAQGPRLDVEQVGDTTVVHNYGHGGSGWSLSWGSSTLAVRKAMASSPRQVAVVGCGALGLTSAILARNAGAEVTIYARELMPETRSSRATGSWTPDSRIALSKSVDPGFPALWEEMARISFKTYHHYLGLPGDPVEWMDRYVVFDAEDGPEAPDPLGFARYRRRHIPDLGNAAEVVPAGSTPFPADVEVRRQSELVFNIADYGHTLMTDFLLAGGRIERREFHSPAELGQLKEKVVINCPGYGARTLWKDESVVPVRGQIGWLIPQPEARYGLYYDGINVLSRRDGIVVQDVRGGDMQGYGDDNETPDRAESEAAVAVLARHFSRFGQGRAG